MARLVQSLMMCAVLLALVADSAWAGQLVYEKGDDVWIADGNGANGRLLQGSVDLYGEMWDFRSPQISPDGLYWVATSDCSPSVAGCSNSWSHVYVGTVDGQMFHKFSGADGDLARDARWSSDGHRVVWAWYGGRYSSNGWDITADDVQPFDSGFGQTWLIGTGGIAPYDTQLITWAGNQRHPEYSADGEHLVFDSDATPDGRSYSDSQARVYMTNSDGTSPREITTGSDPTISPSGDLIIFAKPAKKGGPTQLYSVSTAGGTPTRLTNSTTIDSAPEFTSDGLQVIFTRCNTAGTGCALWTMTPAGATQTALISDGARGSGQQAASDANREAAVASDFQPILKFDKGEKWRPLNIEGLLGEEDNNGQPLHWVCDSGSCNTITSSASLAIHATSTAFIDFGSFAAPGSAPSPDDYHSPNPSCVGPQPNSDVTVLDCNGGPASSIYYEPTFRSAGYNYLDYWFFYRYNEFIEDNHQGDWEGVTVAPSLTDPATFDWVNFAQHKYMTSYLRDILQCDSGGSGSCGSESGDHLGRRPWVYVAGGTHASYPDQCTDLCTQPGPATLEGDHGGQVNWDRNYDPGNSNALVRFPPALGWSGSTGVWTDWPGSWSADTTVGSPGNQHRFKCPWDGNPYDQTACTSARRPRLSAGAAAAFSCGSWFGPALRASACAQSELERAMRRGRVGHHGRFRFLARVRAASGKGVAQLLGRPLRTGQTIRLRGIAPSDTTLMVSARWRSRVLVARFVRLGLQSGGTATVLFQKGRRPRLVLVRPDGRRVKPAIRFSTTRPK